MKGKLLKVPQFDWAGYITYDELAPAAARQTYWLLNEEFENHDRSIAELTDAAHEAAKEWATTLKRLGLDPENTVATDDDDGELYRLGIAYELTLRRARDLLPAVRRTAT